MKRGRGFDRARRVADLIQKSLAKMLLHEMGDNRFHFVTITSVSLSKDLSYAKVYVSMLIDEEDQIKEMVQALNRQAKALRYQLAKEIEMRIVPELRFHYDSSTAEGFKISNLIDSAIKKTEK